MSRFQIFLAMWIIFSLTVLFISSLFTAGHPSLIWSVVGGFIASSILILFNK